MIKENKEANRQAIRNYTLVYLIRSSILIAALFLSSCSSLPKYHAVRKNSINDSNFIGFYNSDSKVRYNVQFDSSNVYLSLSTWDLGSQRNILMAGLKVYLDETGRKKTGKYWLYQLADTQSGQNRNTEIKEEHILGDDRSQQLFESFTRRNKELILVGFDDTGEKQILSFPAERSPVEIDITMDSTGILNYTAVIPKNELFDDRKHNDGIFSFGLKSGVSERQMNNPGRSSGGGINQGKTGRPGSGGGTGAGKGTQRSGSTRGSQRSTPPVDFWFKVVLSDEE